MRELSSGFAEISSEREASRLIQKIGSSIEGPTKTLIAHAAKRLGWKESRAKHVWYRDARTIKAEEMDRLREVADREFYKKALNSVVELRGLLAEASSERNGKAIARLDDLLAELGAEVRAVDD